MSLSVKHYNGSWIDISDYVVGAGDVPYISRNRDWTLRAETWSVSIASTIRDHASYADNFIFSANEEVAVWDSTILLFHGYIQKAPLNYETMAFDLETKEKVQKLDEVLVDYDSLHAAIYVNATSGYQYRVRSYYPMPIVYFNYLLKQIFGLKGLTLDTSEVDDVDVGTMGFVFKELFIGESELYCLNQSFAAYHTVIDDVFGNYSDSKINCFQLASRILSMFSYVLLRTGIDTYKIKHVNVDTIDYTIADDDKYEYISEEVKVTDVIADLGVKSSFPDSGAKGSYPDERMRYLSNTAFNIDYYYTVGKGSGIDWESNLSVHYINEIVTFDDTKCKIISGMAISSGYLVATTSSAHGLTAGMSFLVFGYAGQHGYNNDIYPGNLYNITEYTALIGVGGTTVQLGEDALASFVYIEGGWIYKDTYTNYKDAFTHTMFFPKSISPDWAADDINLLRWQVRSKVSDYTERKITCPIQTTPAAVVENFIDLENRTSKLIQETY